MACPAAQYPLSLGSAFHELAATMAITVMLVEDDPAFLTRFYGIVAADAELESFATAGDCASALQAISKSAPDVLPATQTVQGRCHHAGPEPGGKRWPLTARVVSAIAICQGVELHRNRRPAEDFPTYGDDSCEEDIPNACGAFPERGRL
jgi:hypothetical protein